jgi:hypothetical protein
MRHAKPIAILTAAALTLGLPLAVYAQALPEAAATVAPVADPLLSLLGSLGPTGGAGAIVAYVLHSWRTEAARHATERDDLRARLSAIELSWARQEGQTAAVRQMLHDLSTRLGRPLMARFKPPGAVRLKVIPADLSVAMRRCSEHHRHLPRVSAD